MAKKFDDYLSSEMPIERLKKLGASSLGLYELISIIIQTGTREKTAFDISKELINKNRDLRRLSRLTFEELTQIDGIGDSKAARILASLELANRLDDYSSEKKPKISHPADIFNFVKNKIRYSEKEYFLVISLNVKNEILGYEKVALGSSSSISLTSKEVFTNAVRLNAHAIALVHNHPSGSVEPSKSDIITTNKLVEAGNIISISIIDHLIIGENDYYSMVEHADF